jgi:hypothetical protein
MMQNITLRNTIPHHSHVVFDNGDKDMHWRKDIQLGTLDIYMPKTTTRPFLSPCKKSTINGPNI